MIKFYDPSGEAHFGQATITRTTSVNGGLSLTGEVFAGDDVLNGLDYGWWLNFDNEKYVITYKKLSDDTNTIVFDAVQKFFWDFAKVALHSEYNGSHTYDFYLEKLFSGSGYTYQSDATVPAFEKDNWGYKNKLSLFNDIMGQADVEFEVHNERVHIAKQIGSDLTSFVRKGINLSDLTEEMKISDFATYAKGYGAFKDSDDQSKGRLEVEYRSELAKKFGDLEMDPIVDERYTVADNLIAELKNKVDATYTVSMTMNIYDLENAGYPNYESPKVGDWILAIDEALNFKRKIRIIELEEQFDVTGKRIGYTAACGDLSIIDQYTNIQSSMDSRVQRIQESVDNVAISANGKSSNYYGAKEPASADDGDLWFDQSNSDPDKWSIKQWANGRWEQLTLNPGEVDAKVSVAKQAADTAIGNANTAVENANKAVEDAGFANDTATQAKSDAATAGQQAKDALTSAGTAITDAQNALTNSSSAMADSTQARKDSATAIKDAADSLTSAKDALNKVGSLTTSVTSQFTTVDNELKSKVNQTDYDKLKGTVTSQQTEINQNASGIKLKADTTALNELQGTVDKQGSEITLNTNSIKLKADQSSVDTLKGTVDKQGSAIDINTKAIALKASQSTVDTLTGRVSTAEGKITVQADQISQTVSKTELTSKLNGYATQTWSEGKISAAKNEITASVETVNQKVNAMTGDPDNLIIGGDFEDQRAYIGKQSPYWLGLNTVVDNGDKNHGTNKSNTVLQINGLVSGNQDVTSRNIIAVDQAEYNINLKTRWLNTDQLGQIIIYAFEYDANKNPIVPKVIQRDESPHVWKDITAVYKPSSSAVKYMALDVTYADAKSILPVWVDDIRMRLALATTEWTKSLLDVSEGKVSAQVQSVKTDLTNATNTLNNNIATATAGMATQTWVNNKVSLTEGGLSADIQKLRTDTTDNIASATAGMATQTWTQGKLDLTADNLTSQISSVQDGLDTKYTRLEQNLSGVQVTANNAATQSQFTQLANQFTSVIGDLDNLIISGDFEDQRDYLGKQSPYWSSNAIVMDNGDKTTGNNPSATVLQIPGLLSGNNDVASKKLVAVRQEEYKFSLKTRWLSANQLGQIIIFVFEYDANKNFIVQKVVARDTTPTTWHTVTGTYTPSSDKVRYIKFDVTYAGAQGTTPIYVDDIRMALNVATQSQFTQLQSDINLRVQKGDVINQINISPESILIAGQKVHITGQTTIDNAVIKDAMIATLSASKLTAGTIDAGKINVVNLNASNITSGKLNANLISLRASDSGKSIGMDGNGISGWDANGKLRMKWGIQDLAGDGQSDPSNLLFYTGNGNRSFSIGTNTDDTLVIGTEADGMSTLIRSRLRISLDTPDLRIYNHVNDKNYWRINYTDNEPEINTTLPLRGRIGSYNSYISAIYGYVGHFKKLDVGFGQGSPQEGDLTVSADSSGYVLSRAILNRTYSAGGTITITGGGILGRITSASKYKLDISTVNNITEQAHAFLAVEPKQWFDKSETENMAKELTEGDSGSVDSTNVRPYYGYIAEDLYSAGLDNVILRDSNTGELEGIQYDRLTIYHHELIRELYQRVNDLEAKIYSMEANK